MAYTGRDGLSHQETILDWDKTLNTRISVPLTKKDFDEARAYLAWYRQKCIHEILSFNPAVVGTQCHWDHRVGKLVRRNVEKECLEWEEEIIRNPGMSQDELSWAVVWLEKTEEQILANDPKLKLRIHRNKFPEFKNPTG